MPLTQARAGQQSESSHADNWLSPVAADRGRPLLWFVVEPRACERV